MGTDKIKPRHLDENFQLLLNKLEEIQSHIKTYNNLGQIGLSDDDMSSTDFLTNIKTINTALGDGDVIAYLTTDSSDKLHQSVIDKLNNDMNNELGYTMVEGDNGMFVATDGKIIANSSDGYTWERIELNSDSEWFSVAYGNGKFVAVALNSDIAAYSEDGINWETTQFPENESGYIYPTLLFFNVYFTRILKFLSVLATLIVFCVIFKSSHSL